MATCRKFDRRSYIAVEINLVAFEVVAGAEFVGSGDAKAECNINRPMGVGSDGTVNGNLKWRRKPAAVDLVGRLCP